MSLQRTMSEKNPTGKSVVSTNPVLKMLLYPESLITWASLPYPEAAHRSSPITVIE